ncbi:MAG: BON domain-containing protein, partial [Thermoguttaceae bacterium]
GMFFTTSFLGSAMMNKVSDQTIIQKAAQQLSNRGMHSPCQIAVIAHSGDVTLSGTIQFEHQRLTAMHAVRSIDGVRRVVDHLQVQPKNTQWKN